MLIRETVCPFGDLPLKFAYVNEYHKKRTTGVVLYDTYKITVYMSDDLASIVGNKVHNTVAGDIIFYRPDEINHGRFMKDGIFEYLEIFIPIGYFKDFSFKNELMLFLEDASENRINIISPDTENRKEILSIARRIAELLKCGSDLKTAELFGLAFRIVLLCAKLYPEQKRQYRDRIPSQVSKTLSFISEHYAENINLSLLAKNCGCSVTYLSNLFKNYTGVTVYDHLIRTRIAVAQKLLLSGVGVTEACFECGFGDCSNFIATFKREVGMTPHKYKHQQIRS